MCKWCTFTFIGKETSKSLEASNPVIFPLISNSIFTGIVYDNACHLDTYILNREPRPWEYLRCFVDITHFRGHKKVKYRLDSILSSPGSSPRPCPNRPLSWIKVCQKGKKKDLDKVLTKITWAICQSLKYFVLFEALFSYHFIVTIFFSNHVSRGHLGCSRGYDASLYKPFLGEEMQMTQGREQINAIIEKVASSLRQMSYVSYMTILRVMFGFRNLKSRGAI